MERNPMNKKTVFISGSSRGIGKAIALHFARQQYHVFLNCNTSISELDCVALEISKFPGASCTKLVGDVGCASSVKQMFSKVYAVCKQLDVLINNAGISYTGLLTDMSGDEWQNIMDTNLNSLFYLTREVLPTMISRKQGRIINISSIWGIAGASCEVAYSTTKAGINGFTKALAKEVAPSNIQVNAIACGVIDTNMNQQLSTAEADVLASEIPVGRFGTPAEVASLAWNLAHESPYLTGQIITLDGGYL